MIEQLSLAIISIFLIITILSLVVPDLISEAFFINANLDDDDDYINDDID